MKKLSFALAVMPVLSLVTSVALADVSGLPLATPTVDEVPGIEPQYFEIKNRNQCDGATFFKNVFPSLTNGGPGGSATNNFTVDGKNVAVTVTWYLNNSFDFSVDGGYARKVGVTVDQNNFVYDYTGKEAQGISDTQLNFYGPNLTADDVNHLDLCLETLDTVAPSIGNIVVMPAISDDGTTATVTGPISIMTSITDESEQSVMIEIFEIVDGMEVSIDASLILEQPDTVCAPVASGCTKYTWTVDTGELDDGLYTIRITSEDQSILGLDSFRTKDIEVITALEGCLEGIDAIPDGEDGAGGCQKAGVILEYPEALRGQLDPQPVTQLGIPARQAFQTVECGLAPDGVTVLDPFVVKDPRIAADGSVTVGTLPLNLIFEINETLGALGVGPYIVELPDHLYGAICLSLYWQDAPNFDELATLLPPDFFLGFSLNNFLNDPAGNPRTVSVLSQGPEKLSGMYAGSPRLTAPLNFCDRSTDPDCGVLPGCFADDTVQCFQPSQQFIERAVVQADENLLHVRPFAFDGTFEAYNRSRTTSYKGTFGVLNTRRVCPALVNSPLVPGTADYLEAELECMVLQTLEVFFDTETAIKEADRNLISPDVTRLLNPHSKALGQIKNFHFDRALRYLDDLLDQIYRAEWNIDINNDPGRLTMMVLALRFQVEQHLATETCLEDPACLAILGSQP